MRILRMNKEGMFTVITKELSIVYNWYNAPVAILMDDNMLLTSRDEFYENTINSFFNSEYIVKVISKNDFVTMVDSI